MHFASQLFPLNPTAQAMFKKVKNKLQKCTYEEKHWRRLSDCTYHSRKHSILVVSHLYPTQHSIFPPTTLQWYYTSLIKGKSYLNFEISTFKMHITYLPHMLQNTEGKMLTNVTKTVLNLTLNSIFLFMNAHRFLQTTYI